MLSLREVDNGRTIALYITGIEPEEDTMGEPIVIRLAGQAEENQTLKQWVELQYPSESQQNFQELAVNGLTAIRVRGSENESGCNTDWTFFLKDRSIIGIAWTCNTMTALE